jgi:hypothetical protein
MLEAALVVRAKNMLKHVEVLYCDGSIADERLDLNLSHAAIFVLDKFILFILTA